MYVKVKLNSFNGEKVKLYFYDVESNNSKTLISKSGAITVSNKRTVSYKIIFSQEHYKNKLKNGNENGTGYVAYEVVSYDEKEILKNGKVVETCFDPYKTRVIF